MIVGIVHPHSTESQMETHSILGTQELPNPKPIEEIVLVPSVARVLVLSGQASWNRWVLIG